MGAGQQQSEFDQEMMMPPDGMGGPPLDGPPDMPPWGPGPPPPDWIEPGDGPPWGGHEGGPPPPEGLLGNAPPPREFDRPMRRPERTCVYWMSGYCYKVRSTKTK